MNRHEIRIEGGGAVSNSITWFFSILFFFIFYFLNILFSISPFFSFCLFHSWKCQAESVKGRKKCWIMRVSFHFFLCCISSCYLLFFSSSVFFFSFLFSYYYFCVGPNPLLFIFERMQIGFTKKGLPAGQPRIKLHHPAMQCVSNREPHQHEQTPIIHLPPTSQSKSEIGK